MVYTKQVDPKSVVIDSSTYLSYPQLEACLEDTMYSPDTWPYKLLPAIIDAGKLADVGNELFRHSQSDSLRREFGLVAKVNLADELIIPNLTDALVGDRDSVMIPLMVERKLLNGFVTNDHLASIIHTHPLLNHTEMYAYPPSPYDLATMFIDGALGPQISMVYTLGKAIKRRINNWMLVRTLETTAKDLSELEGWGADKHQQIIDQTTKILNSKRSIDGLRELVFKSESINFLLKAALHHKVGIYGNDGSNTRFTRYDLLPE